MHGIVMQKLGIALSSFFILLILNRLRVSSQIPYLFGGLSMWYFMEASGVHATIAGVLLAFTIPMKSPYSNFSPLEDLESELHSVTSRSEEHTSELHSLMRISYDVFCLKTKHII